MSVLPRRYRSYVDITCTWYLDRYPSFVGISCLWYLDRYLSYVGISHKKFAWSTCTYRQKPFYLCKNCDFKFRSLQVGKHCWSYSIHLLYFSINAKFSLHENSLDVELFVLLRFRWFWFERFVIFVKYWYFLWKTTVICRF